MKTIKITRNQWNRQLAGPCPKVEGLVLRRAMRQRTPGRRSAAEKYMIRWQIKQVDEKKDSRWRINEHLSEIVKKLNENHENQWKEQKSWKLIKNVQHLRRSMENQLKAAHINETLLKINSKFLKHKSKGNSKKFN